MREGSVSGGRVWITRARYKRLVDGLTGGSYALEPQVREALDLEFVVIDPLPLLAITPEAKEVLISLVASLAGDPSNHRPYAERLLRENLEIVDA